MRRNFDGLPKIDGLPKDQQIKKLKTDSKIRLIVNCILLPIIIGLSIYLIISTEQVQLGINFLLATPLSFYFGYILPVKCNNKKIKELEENN